MNKTIIININGIVFHIEEDAYEILKSYMTDVKRHFANEEDSVEITTDIENRIAEMFTEILERELRQVVVTTDVTTVISQMGTIEDFETTDAEQKSGYQPGFTGSRKLFRDADDHLLGGVCAGIANYFDIDAIWIRVAFAITSFIAGTGAMAYLILWIIVPKATSRADRMAMKGEKLDLKGFVKNFEEEVKSVHTSLSNAGTHARPFAYQVRDFVGDFIAHLGYFLRGTGRLILKVFGVFALVVCFGILLTLVICLALLLIFGQHEAWEWFHISLPYYNNAYLLVIAVFLLIILPILAIIQLTLRVVFTRGFTYYRNTGYTMLIVWLVALTTVIYFSVKIGEDFRAYASFSRNINIAPTTNNTYLLTLNRAKYISKEDSARLNIKSRFQGDITLNDNDFDEFNDFQQRMTLTIERSDIDQPVLVESFSAHGRDYDSALLNAQNTEYNFVQQDSVLKFSRRLAKFTVNHYENQRIELTLKLPLNAHVIIDKSVRSFLENVDVRNCNETNKLDDPERTFFNMTSNGLQCKVDTLTTYMLKTDTTQIAAPQQ